MTAHLAEFRRALRAGGFCGGLTIGGVARAIRLYQDRVRDVQTREAQARRASLVAQLEALQARLQPHFLFNCLNTVAGLIEEDPARAEAAIEKLSDLLRYKLDTARQTTVPLDAELAIVRDYLELETLRYGERPRVQVDVDPVVRDARVPPLVLQPLVENAVLHGTARRREGGRLAVEAARDGARVRLTVEDDGPGPGRSGHSGTGTALDDLRRRLGLLYGDGAAVEEDSGPLGGYRLRLWLPLEREARSA